MSRKNPCSLYRAERYSGGAFQGLTLTDIVEE